MFFSQVSAVFSLQKNTRTFRDARVETAHRFISQKSAKTRKSHCNAQQVLCDVFSVNCNLKHEKRSSICFVCQGLLRLQYIYHYFSQVDVHLEVYIRRVDSAEDCIVALDSLSSSGSPQKHVKVVMDIAAEKTQRLILSMILKRRILRFNYHYLTVSVVSYLLFPLASYFLFTFSFLSSCRASRS